MIPLKIHLKNFLSYGAEPQTIDFTPYHLICLCGKNGHGKSALLDAITWALWGTARKVLGESKPDVGLLRLGQTQMQVILDFSFNNQTYRVRREFAKTHGKPHAVLEFGLLDEATDTIIPLTDKTIKATQAKIITTLNITAESFINSAFIRQGNANEFSQKAPKDRKKVLASILGLDTYDQLRQRAQERMKGLQLRKQALSGSLDMLRQELATKDAICTRAATLAHELAAVQQDELLLKKKLQNIEDQKKKLAAHQQEAHAYQVHHEHMAQDQHEKQRNLRQLVHAWRATHRHHRTLNYAQLEEERITIHKALALYQERMTQRLTAQATLLTLREQAQQRERLLHQEHERSLLNHEMALQKLRMQQEMHAKRAQELTALLGTQEKILNEHAQAETAIAHALQQHQDRSPDLEKIEQQIARRKNYYQLFITQGNWITQQSNELNKKKLLVHDDTNPSCPLCEQNLSAARKRFLKKSFDEQEQFLHHRFTRLKNIVGRLKTLLVEQHAHREKLKAEQVEHAQHTARHATIRSERSRLLVEHAATVAEHATVQEMMHTMFEQITHQEKLLHAVRTDMTTRIQHDHEYQALQYSITATSTIIASLAHDQAQYETYMQRLSIIQEQLATQSDRTQYQAVQTERRHAIDELCTQLKKINAQLHAHAKKIAAHHAQAPCARTLDEACQSFLHEETKIRSHKEALLHEQGQVQQQLTKLAQLEQHHAERDKEINTLQAEMEEYSIIAAAMGKDGLQALLIEESIPEIEHEANQLLAKLTDNQTHIFIESLKDLKNGGTKETLDIRVSDSMGIRPYEMFSGGEAFRIDFALRVGIAKLLAHRAGTSLQTLIIDEGFGSQDEEGLHLIMDAIHRIQDDFAKIIIVSHLNAMKNQFPVHFLVQKLPHGSTVNIIEQA